MQKFSLTQVITTVTAVVALVTAVFTIDGRYTKTTELERIKKEIVSELRTEVSKNRRVMIEALQMAADDFAYQIALIRNSGETVPRYLIDKHQTLLRTIEEIRNEQNT